MFTVKDLLTRIRKINQLHKINPILCLVDFLHFLVVYSWPFQKKEDTKHNP